MTGRAKAHLKTGMLTMGGNLALGSIAATPGMPKQGLNSLNTISSGMNLTNIGELSKTSMSFSDMFSKNKKKKTRR